MELGNPFAVVTSSLDGKVLRVLAQADAEFTSGDIHRVLPDASIRGITNVLGRLTDQGIVARRPAGRAGLYRLNHAHLAAPYVLGIAHLRDDLLDRLSREVSGWVVPPIFGSVFGSGARTDHTATSDVDLFFVRPDNCSEDVWDTQVAGLVAHVTAWTGNDARVLEFAASDVVAKGAREPVLRSIARESLVFAGSRDWITSAVHDGPAQRR